jgi:serine/threonine-protein kinase
LNGRTGKPVAPSAEVTMAQADRDALLAIVARDLGFITADDFTAATKARGTDRGKALGELLLERNAVGAEELATLNALVDSLLRRNGNDPRQSLDAIATNLWRQDSRGISATELAERVAGGSRNPNGVPTTSAEKAEENARDNAGGDAHGSALSPRSPRPRYRILRHHASGGLGRVYVAYDEELNREVALKEIHTRYGHLADCRARFLLEAEVTGRLEHPGIVPVYGLGKYEDGLPYYAMRFIQGESLKDAIQNYHQTRSPDTGQRMLALRHLLGVFLAVCQAVRYAHSRGVVHRDLKPENVMLGKFGETLVVDWGLAKSLGPLPDASTISGAETADGPLRLEPEGVPLVTRAGTVLGTPGYMSPEQADGMLSELSAASDVYSLGATLYTILTGRPPMTAETPAGAPGGGSNASFPSPRAVDRRVPRALEAVCLKAMALLPRDRYPGPGELAADVNRWLADEPVAAYREPLSVRTGRWVRKHPARVASLIAATLVGAIGLSIGVVVVADRNRELGAANLRETEARRQADARFREAQGAVNEFFTEISENKELLKKQPGSQALRQQLLAKARDYYEVFLRERGDDPDVRAEAAAAHFRLGEISNSLSPGSPQALEHYQRGLTVLEPLLREGTRRPDHLLTQAKLHWGMGMTLGRADRFDDGLASFEKARVVLETLSADQPDAAEYKYQLARTFGGMAYIRGRSNRDEEALADNLRAVALCEQLVRDHPDVADYAERLAITHLNMGADRKAAGDYAGAQQCVTRALAVSERLVQRNPGVAQYVQVVVYAFNNMGHYQTVLGQRDEAVSTLTRGSDVAERLARESPGVPDYANILAYMLYNRGILELQQGMPDAALASFSRGRPIMERLTQEYPGQHQYANIEAQIAHGIGWATYATGKEDAAAEAFSRSLTLWTRLAREDPKVSGPASSAAWLLADCPIARLRDPARATELTRPYLTREPDSAGNLAAYGLARFRSGDYVEATGALERALRILPEIDESRATTELVAVMTRWQCGQKEAARELYDRAAARMDKAGLRHPEYRALLTEAAMLLGVDAFPRRKPSP